MRIHRAVDAVVVVAPDALDQKLATERATGMFGEELEQLEFLGGKVQLRAIQGRADALAGSTWSGPRIMGWTASSARQTPPSQRRGVVCIACPPNGHSAHRG